MQSFSWTCPYCNRITTITGANITQSEHPFLRAFRDDAFVLVTDVIVCPNRECQEYTITAILRKGTNPPYDRREKIYVDWGADPSPILEDKTSIAGKTISELCAQTYYCRL